MTEFTDFHLLSFDVYGTLIDWETGILNNLEPLYTRANLEMQREAALELYHELEAAQQTQTPAMPYSQLLAEVYPQFAARLGLGFPSAQESETFGQSVGDWPAFPDTVDALRRLAKHYKMVALSNTDKVSLAATAAGPLEGFAFDKVITAQEVGSYKPDLRNFEFMLDAVQSEYGVDKSRVLQTAQSQIHDHHPAKKMGIRSVWIERGGPGAMGSRQDVMYDWNFVTLGDMADAVEKELGILSK